MAEFIVGLTGGIGSGKTTVANLFAKLGIVIIDADIVAREVVKKGSQGLAQITQYFGQEILDDKQELDRAKLRQHIFTHPKDKQWLNGLLHPLIRTTMLKQAKVACSPYAIMVVPLLFENGVDKLVDTTLVVDISPELQLSRTQARDNVPSQQVSNIINSQSSRENRLAKADNVIDNKGLIAGLSHQVLSLHQNYLSRSKLA